MERVRYVGWMLSPTGQKKPAPPHVHVIKVADSDRGGVGLGTRTSPLPPRPVNHSLSALPKMYVGPPTTTSGLNPRNSHKSRYARRLLLLVIGAMQLGLNRANSFSSGPEYYALTARMRAEKNERTPLTDYYGLLVHDMTTSRPETVRNPRLGPVRCAGDTRGVP